MESGWLTPNQRRGLITLIPKKNKDRRRLENWRPISLLKVDYKILAKVIANRLTHVVDKLVNVNQTGFIPGRFIGSNLRNISDVISFFQKEEGGGILASLDFAKAFDTLDRDFLFKTLKSYNFGDSLIKWVKLLYQGAQSCVINNSFSSGWFEVEAGLRQGCPASPLLFVLAVEKLAHAICIDGDIQGISLRGNEYKLSQYADDSNMFVKDGKSLENLLEKVRDFGSFSGLHLNVEKSQGLKINCNPVLLPMGQRIQWKSHVNILGSDFYGSQSDEGRIERDFMKYIDKMEEICSTWQRRKIPLKGMVVVVNTLVLPIIAYASRNTYCPENVIKKVNRLVSDFLWNGHSAKIALNTLCLSTEKGVLGLHNFYAHIEASRVAGIKRMVTAPSDLWTDFLVLKCNVESISDIPMRKQRSNFVDVPKFYRDVFVTWQKIYCTEPNSDITVRNEPLWYNKFTRWQPLSKYVQIWSGRGMKRINDVLYRDRILSREEMNRKFDLNLRRQTYNCVTKIIPDAWLEKLIPVDRVIRGAKLFVRDTKG